MSLWERITNAVGNDMDEKVAAPGGISAQRYAALIDDDELHVQASVTNAHARIELRGPTSTRVLTPHTSHAVGLGRDLAGQQLSIVAQIDAPLDPTLLVVLRVAVFTRSATAPAGERNGVESYSVEARLDVHQRATLELQLQLG